MKDAFESFLKAYNLKSRFNETYLITYWEKIMGASIANRTEKIYVRNGVLFLRISSSPLRQELVLAKSKLMEHHNAEIGEAIIQDVVFI